MAEESSSSNLQRKERRLWIGNLDFRVTEYQLLKLVQKYGSIEKFDLLFHRTGPQAGQPRGYAFVTYEKEEDALIAKERLHNIQIGQKKINVTWANNISNEEITKPQDHVIIPALAISKPQQKTDRESQIQAIEAKLKLMEKKRMEDLKINDTVATKLPVISQFQHNKTQNNLSNASVRTKLADLKKIKPYKKGHSVKR